MTDFHKGVGRKSVSRSGAHRDVLEDRRSATTDLRQPSIAFLWSLAPYVLGCGAAPLGGRSATDSPPSRNLSPSLASCVVLDADAALLGSQNERLPL